MNDHATHKSSKGGRIPGVHCDVSNCAYNDKECSCFADQINVGPTHAEKTDDTICATFKQE